MTISFYEHPIRLIKPSWGKKNLSNGSKNPDFKKQIAGSDVVEGYFKHEDIVRMNSMGYNAYWFPNKPIESVYDNNIRHLSGKHIDDINYLLVDMDLKDRVYDTVGDFLKVVKIFDVKPTLTVKSGNGCHLYFKVNGLTKESYCKMQFGLINHFDTDKSFFTVLQPFRIPGSLNTKEYGNFKQTEIVNDLSSRQTYNLSDFPELPITEIQAKKAARHIAKLNGEFEFNLDESVDIAKLPDKFNKLLEDNNYVSELWYDPRKSGDRSSADFKLCLQLRKNGFTETEALAVILQTKKTLEHGSPESYATLTVENAYSMELEPKIASKCNHQILKKMIDRMYDEQF